MRYSSRTYALAAIATTALAVGALSPMAAMAASGSAKADQAATASKAGNANTNLQISENGFDVMRDIRAARIAIFNGDTELAVKFVKQAQTDLGNARIEDAALVKKAGETGAANWIAIDGQLLVSDNFVVTPQKAASIKKSNVALKKGDTKTAVDTLKDAQIDVGFTRVLMPISQTANHIETALGLMTNQEFYQANLALKAAEDGLNVDTVMLYDAPGAATSGAQSTGATSTGS